MSLTQRTDCRCFLVVFVVFIWIELIPLFQCFDHARTVSGLVAGNSKNLGHTMNMIDDDDDDGDENIYYGSLNGQSDNAAVKQDSNWKDYRHGIPGHASIKSIHGELNPINHNDNDTKDDDDDDDDYEYDYSTGISAGKNLHINNNDDDAERKHGNGLWQGQQQQHQRKITKFHYGTSIINNNNNNKTQSKSVMAKARLEEIPNGINIMATSTQHRNDDRIIMNQNQKMSKKPKNKEEEKKDSNHSMKAKKQQRWQTNNHNNGKNMENVLGRFNLFHSKPNPLSWFWPSSSSSSSSAAAKQQWKQVDPNRKHTTTTINNKNNNNENELSSFCLELKCGPDEYCFKPEAGVAECLKKENAKNFRVHESVHGRHRNSNNNNNMINRPTKNNIKNKWSNNKNSANLMDFEDNDDDDDGVLFQDDDQDDLVDHDQHYQRKKSGKNLRSNKEIDGKFNRKKNNQNVNDSNRTSLANQQRRMPTKISNNQPRMNGDGNQIKNANNPKSSNNNKTKIIQCPSCPFTYGQIVCGTNNVSYSSMCRIEFHNCVHETNIKFACFGFCPCTKISNNNNNDNNPHQHQEPKPSRRQSGDWDSADHPEILLLNQSHTKHSMAGLSRESLKRYHYDFGHQNVSNGGRFRPSPKNCSAEELHSMGVRLLDWFLVVMKEEIKHRNKSTSQKLTSSGVQQTELPDCEEQVSFMFYHFDLDHNFKLTTKELYYLKHDENEHCLEPYLLQCDEDRDDLLSAHEWCSCFDFRSKPCLYQRRQIAKKNPNGLKPTQYVPQCDQNGHYRNVQCNPSNNYCWCSDKNGNEIAGTGVHGRLAICDKVYPLSLNRFSNNNNNNKNNKRIQPPPTPQQQQQQQKKRQQVLVLNLDQELNGRSKVSNPAKKPMPLANRDHKLRRVSDGQDHHRHHDQDDDDDDESGDDDDDDDDEEGSFSMDRGSGLDSF